MTFLLLFSAHIWFAYRRLLQHHRYFQQENYQAGRFVRWWWKSRAFDQKGSLATLIQWTFPLSGALALIPLSDRDATKEGKLRLDMTPRAKRLFVAAGLLYLAVAIPLLLVYGPMTQLILFQVAPFFLPIAGVLLQPDENRRQRKFQQEAMVRLHKIDPFVIGITGSYGKSSTKIALGQLLQMALGPTFWPEKGINTPMGITRAIREELNPGTEYAVIEMGAYGIGSIKRLCELTPPRAAIITAIGPCHLERFGSLETTLRAKSELAEALPDDGILVLNGDDPLVRTIKRPGAVIYGFDPSYSCWASDVAVAPTGTHFTLHWKGQSYPILAPVFGQHQVSNLLAAFTMAAALGANPELLAGALRRVQPLANRLDITSAQGVTWLRDGYNSNPSGFSAALNVLSELPAGRRILMTPGMIELGSDQSNENRRLAKQAASVCDRVIVVGDTNKRALLDGLRDGGLDPEEITVAPTRTAAFDILEELRAKGDSILVENDLPDLYERTHRF